MPDTISVWDRNEAWHRRRWIRATGRTGAERIPAYTPKENAMSATRRTHIRIVDNPTASPFFSPRGPGASAKRTVWNEPPAFEITTIEASDAEVAEQSRDPSVIVSGVLPTRLIAPTPSNAAAASPAWGIDEVGAGLSAFDGAGVNVAVLDTGIDRNHPAFAGVNIVEQDFSGTGNGDLNGHGTHCAGTIFGRDVNGVRIGVARGVTDAMIGKVLDNNGSGDTDMLLRGMTWAITGGASIMSMSIGLDFTGYVDSLVNNSGYSIRQATSIALREYAATLRAFDAVLDLAQASRNFTGGTLVVAAGGNDAMNPQQPITASIPAASDGVVSVGAVARHGAGVRIAPFSNADCQLVGPGVDVLSAKAGGGLVAFDGTSMACPHVAGVAALWRQALAKQGLPADFASVTAKLLAQANIANIIQYSRFLHGSGVVRSP
jgi:subtilisin family serine protease